MKVGFPNSEVFGQKIFWKFSFNKILFHFWKNDYFWLINYAMYFIKNRKYNIKGLKKYFCCEKFPNFSFSDLERLILWGFQVNTADMASSRKSIDERMARELRWWISIEPESGVYEWRQRVHVAEICQKTFSPLKSYKNVSKRNNFDFKLSIETPSGLNGWYP